jgi:glycine/serine hydroxymethyltransferase
MDVDQLLDTALSALIRQQQAARDTITLIPSENRTPLLARLAYLTDASHRYFFAAGDPGALRFPAGRDAGTVETGLTVPLLQHLAQARHVNVRPLSGLHAMTVLMSALTTPGATVLTVAPQQGGHYATASVARRLGLTCVHVGGPDPHQLDLPALTELVARHRPALVYLDVSHGLFPLDLTATAGAVRDAGVATRIHADVSHTMGLVLGGLLPNPLRCGADSFGGSTHKSLPGPAKAFLATDDDTVATAISAAQYELISSHHLAGVCGLGLALAQFVLADGPSYARTVVAAARSLAAALAAAGLVPEAAERGFTGCHQLWLDTSRASIDAPTAAVRLDAAGIRVNVLDDLPGFDGRPGLRLGLAEAVTVGLDPDDMPYLGALMTSAIRGTRPAPAIAADVAALRHARTSRYDLADDSPVKRRAEQLIAAVHATAAPAAAGAR